MQENLLGYLLGALDGPEHEQMRKQLEWDAPLREQLARLEKKLEPLECDRWQHEPPVGLAAATCQLVAEQAASKTTRRNHECLSQAGPSGMSSMSEWNPRKHGWDMMDMAVAAGIFVAAALLFFPAISNSRRLAHQLACQNNLRAGSFAVSIFGESHNGVLPYIPTKGKTGVAGYYAPQLMDGGFVTQHATFLCPGSTIGSNVRDTFRVPTTHQIRSAQGQKLKDLQRTMGGSYMYNLGHYKGRSHRSTKIRGRSNFPIMADGIQNIHGELQSPHGVEGINVVFEGGNIRFMVLTRQHPYVISERGMVEAGVDEADAVLGHSWTRPSPSQSVELDYPSNEPSSDLGRDLQATGDDIFAMPL